MKRSDDKLVLRAALSVSSALFVIPFAFIVPLPTANVWPFLIGGAVVHLIYQIFYVAAFQRGDMSLVYPIMRGIAPAIAAVFAFVFLSETLNFIEVLGLLITVSALIAFGWPSDETDRLQNMAILMAVLCGTMIALYSVVDAAGMRLSKSVLNQGWTYIVWFFLLDCLGMPVLVAMRRRGALIAAVKPQIPAGLLAGLLSLISFGLALYAFSLAPVAKMSAMREVSVVFGALFAATFLKEPFGRRRVILAIILASGLFLMQSA
ncbi:MAG: EamA family transporter [Hellea sp.]|nr:EamA family transporter [Hellea sp.]